MEVWTIIKELTISYYDPDSKKIMNCRKRSLAWYHEYRHHQQLRNPFTNFVWKWSPMLISVLTLFLVYLILTGETILLLFFSGLASLPMAILMMMMELDAWVYSIYKVIK